MLFAFALAGVVAQSAASGQTPVITGRIVERGSNTPLAGVRVMLMPDASGPQRLWEQPKTAVTGDAGHFRFDDVTPGSYRIVAQKAGFTPMPIARAVPVTVAGHAVSLEDIVLQKGAAVAGHVFDDAGHPLAGVRVMAVSWPRDAVGNVLGPGPFFLPGGNTETNDLGEFRVAGVPPGAYAIVALPRDESNAGPGKETMLPTFFPSASDHEAAQFVTLASGGTASAIDIRMVGVPAFSVAGVVSDGEGRPVANALVRLMYAGDVPLPFLTRFKQTRTNDAGRFVIGATPAGRYTLMAIAPLTSGAPQQGAGAIGWSAGIIGGSVSGAIGRGGITTHTSNGVTVTYRDDAGTRLPVVVSEGDVSGLEVVVKTGW